MAYIRDRLFTIPEVFYPALLGKAGGWPIKGPTRKVEMPLARLAGEHIGFLFNLFVVLGDQQGARGSDDPRMGLEPKRFRDEWLAKAGTEPGQFLLTKVGRSSPRSQLPVVGAPAGAVISYMKFTGSLFSQ